MNEEKIVRTCAECGCVIEDNDDYYEFEGKIYCEDCNDELFEICEDCGAKCFRDEMNWIEGYDHYVCEDCYEEYIEEKAIYFYHHSHDEETIFFGGTDNGKELFLGLEIEIDNGDDREYTARQMKNVMPTNFITMERDGSLDCGFENITQPATLEYHTSIRDKYEEMFQIAKDNGFRSHNTSTCGYHIHFNRTFFEDKHDENVAKLLYLIEKFWDELVKFSRRNYENLDRWAKKYDKTPNEVVEDMKCRNLDRYHAVNLTNRNTIEFRMFRGTLKSETFFATLQLVDTIVRYVKEHTNNDIQSLEFTDLLITDELKAYWERVKNRGC